MTMQDILGQSTCVVNRCAGFRSVDTGCAAVGMRLRFVRGARTWIIYKIVWLRGAPGFGPPQTMTHMTHNDAFSIEVLWARALTANMG